MKKLPLLLIGLGTSLSGFSQWTGTNPLTTTSNVGIGTAAPATALTVQTAATNNGIRIIQTGTTASALGLFNSSAGARNWALFSAGSGNSQGAGNFSIFDYSGGGDRFFIQGATGNVGIGSTTPVAKLQLNGNALFTNVAGSPTSAAYIRGNSILSTQTTPEYTWWNNDQTGFFHPAANVIGFTNGGVESARITASGFVGIGTSTPSDKLHIHNGAIKITGTNSSGGPMVLFGGTTSSAPGGEYGIEYLSGDHGLNFWKPYASHNVAGTTGGTSNYILFINDDNNVGIGVQPATMNVPSYQYKLSVNGAIRANKVVVEIGWADYVFNKDYKLPALSEVEKFITENKHLQNIPSAKEIEEKGLDVGAVQAKQMEKIEELTLYIIELNKRIEELEKK